MTDQLKAFDPDDDWTKRDEPFRDSERDKKPGFDISSLDAAGARHASRGCGYCDGQGFATIYRPDYNGSPVLTLISSDGTERNVVARATAYCECAFGRWLMVNHKKHAPDIYARTPDFCDIRGKSSYWLEHDPTLPHPSEPQPFAGMSTVEAFAEILGKRMRVRHDKAKESRDSSDRITQEFPD